MKRIKTISIFQISLLLWTYPGVRAGPGPYEVTTYVVHEGREARGGGASVVYACNTGKEAGPCLDSPLSCTSQGGRFVGYCFFDGKYEGVCCTGVNPAAIKPPAIHDDSSTSGPQPPTLSTQTLPPVTSDTFPPAPTQTMPPSSSLPPSSTLPPAPTQTMPPSSSLPPAPTQTLPPSSSLSTESMPPAPTQTLPPSSTLPPAPSQTMPPSSTLPPAPSQTMPPSSSLSTETFPPAPTQTLPPSSTLPPAPSQTMPPSSSLSTESLPPAPTQTAPPSSSLPSDTMPPAPTQTMPPSSSLSTESVPTLPPAPTPPQTPAPPTPPPASSSAAVVTTIRPPHFDNSSSSHPTFPTFPTQTMSTPSSTSLPNMTMTPPKFPSTSTEASSPEQPSEAPTEPPSFDVPGESSGCSPITNALQSIFENPSYPSLDTEANVYQYSVMPQDGYCALRIEFIEAILASKGMEGCSTDSVVIIDSAETPTTPLCGLLQGYQLTVRSEPEQPVKLVVTAQSQAHMWRINLTQISCDSIRPYQEYEAPDCGIKNPKQPPPGVSIHHAKEEPKVIQPIKLLKSKKKTYRDITSEPYLAPSKFLQNAVLNRESNIKIVRGNETGINEWPWQALLMVYNRPLCGASIINEEYLLTAGHCVQLSLRYPLQSVLTVDIGDHDLLSSKETRNVVLRVEKIIPNVQNEGVRNDIALIKLAQKINFGKTIRPVCLPQPKTPPDTYAGQRGVTTGWGKTEDAVISPVLREAHVPIISNEKCRQQWSAVGEGAGSLIESGMMCVGGGDNDPGPCNGDSGGPVVVSDQEEDKWRLVGLTSFGLLRGCAVPGVPSVYTRLTSYLDWLALNLAI